jgi:ATP-dependent Clp protease ATP-binding subunit ClpC
MFERYTEEARRAIFFSAWEARQAASAYIEPEHLLLSLTHDANSKANHLFALTAPADNFRKQWGLPIWVMEQAPNSNHIPLSNPSKRVLAYAAEEADQLASKAIGTEHLLLGLLREKKSDVPDALAAAGIDLRSARNRIRQELGLPIPEREPERREALPKSLITLRALLLLMGVLVLIYLIVRLVNS